MTWARLMLSALIISMLAGLVVAINAHATASAELRQETARADGLAQQVASVAAEYNKQLQAQEEAYRARDSIRKAGEVRRREADALITRDATDEVMGWRNARVPAPVTDSLCIKAGSCAVSGTGEAAGGVTQAGTGNATQLLNESLRAGIEDLRQDLASCNGQLAGLRAWAESLRDNHGR